MQFDAIRMELLWICIGGWWIPSIHMTVSKEKDCVVLEEDALWRLVTDHVAEDL